MPAPHLCAAGKSAPLVRARMTPPALAVHVAFAATLSLGLAGGAGAQEATQTVQYDVPAGPLADALNRFAQQSGVAIVLDANQLRGLTSAGLKGGYGVEEGFGILLRGSGYTVSKTANGYLLLAAPGAPIAPAASGTSAPASRETNLDTLPPVTVRAPAWRETATGSVPGYIARRSETATKIDLPLIETPQSISVVTRDQMDAQGAHTVAEALDYTAGVVTGTNGGQTRFDSIFIRGLGGFAAEAGFARYVDGLQWPQGPRNVSQIDPYALERVEVLRGPSSVLYGQASPGGFVNMVSKGPTEQPQREIMLQLGNHNYKTLGVDLSGPLDAAGTLSFRLPMLVRDADSQTRFQHERRQMVAPSITWRPDAATTLTLRGFYQHDPDQPDSSLLPPLSIVPAGALPRNFYNGDPNLLYFKRTARSVGYSFEHRFNDTWTFRQIARYDEYRTDNGLVSPSVMLDDGRTLTRYTSRFRPDARSTGIDTRLEARFVTGAIRHTALIGLDYKKPMTSLKLGYGEAPDLDVYAPVYGAVPLETPALTRQQLTRAEQTGVYLQDHLRYEQWAVTLGARHDRARSSTWVRPLASEDPGEPTRQADGRLTGRVGAVYLAGNGWAPYVSYSTSFEPVVGADRLGTAFKPTEGKQFEVGVRWMPAGSRTSIAAALFDLRRTNILTSDPVAPDDFDVQTGEVRSRGFELEVRTAVTEHVNVIANLARSDVRVTRDNVPEKVGRPLMGSPTYTGSIWLDTRVPLSRGNAITAGLGVRYVGSSWGDTYGGYQIPAYRVPAYTLVDMALGYSLSKDLSLVLNGRNVLDKQYVAACSYAFCYGGKGRTVLATLRYRFP